MLLLMAASIWAQDRQWIVTSDELVTYETVNYTNPVDTLRRGNVIKEQREMSGHIKYLNNGHFAYAPMTGLEEWNGMAWKLYPTERL